MLSHHPVASGLLDLPEVMDIHTDILVKSGVPDELSAKLLKERKEQVSIGVRKGNMLKAKMARRLCTR